MEKSFTPSAIRKRLWRLNNPERYLKSNRERSWWLLGINIDKANELRDSIKNCQICGSVNRLCVDHNHVTGEIRGILCSKCNKGLGIFNDSQQLLRKAANYLEVDNHGC